MTPTSRLYDALSHYLSQCDIQWRDARHLSTLCSMMIGMIESQHVHLSGFGMSVISRAQVAQSHQRRFRRWLSNRRIDVMSAHHALVRQALSGWTHPSLYLSLDTTLVWNCFCIVWVGGLSRQDNPCRVASGGAIEQHREGVDDSASPEASGTRHARWGCHCPAG